MTTRLVGAALAALALLPATAQAATLTPLKPCYISVTQTAPAPRRRSRASRSTSAAAASRPAALVDVSSTGRSTARSRPTRPATSRPRPAVALPGEGPGHVHADRGRARQPGQHGRAAVAHDGADAQAQAQAGEAVDARPLQGRGLHGAEGGVGALPLQGQGAQDRPAGQADQEPLRDVLGQAQADPGQAARSSGAWRLQVDQQKGYSRAPDGVNVRADINVQRVFR